MVDGDRIVEIVEICDELVGWEGVDGMDGGWCFIVTTWLNNNKGWISWEELSRNNTLWWCWF